MFPWRGASAGRIRGPGGGRGQSSPIGLVLVFAIVMAGATLTVAISAEAFTSTQDQLDIERAEKTMTQLDSQAAMVALGHSNVQQVSIPSSSGYVVEEDAGWMNVSHHNTSSGDKTVVFNETMGAVVFRAGGTSVAYQGGGVWRLGDGSARMISPPEFHYRDATLTLPMIQVRGDDSISGKATITHNTTVNRFPNETANQNFLNPVRDGHVNVTVRSDYYQAWGEYFSTRTDGTVYYDHSNNIAIIKLVVPFDESYEHVVATTAPNGLVVNGAGSPPSPYEEGVPYPSVDSRVDDQIDQCQSNPATCDPIPLTPITSSGTYFHDGDFTDGIVVDNPGGDVTVVINGDLTLGGGDDVVVTSLDSDESVTVFVRGDVDVGTGLNEFDGDATELRTIVHSDGRVDMNGNYRYRGLLYAPQSGCRFNGGGGPMVKNFKGGVVCESVTINGNPSNEFEYDASVNDVVLALDDDDVTHVNFLHTSTNQVNVTNGR